MIACKAARLAFAPAISLLLILLATRCHAVCTCRGGGTDCGVFMNIIGDKKVGAVRTWCMPSCFSYLTASALRTGLSTAQAQVE